jgi:flagellar hook-length control protein FliK
MQIKDKPDSSPQLDTRRPIRVLAPTYQLTSSGGESDLFAEIFQSIAAIVAPPQSAQPTDANPPTDDGVSALASTEEASSTQDEEDDLEKEVVATATPILQTPIQAEPTPASEVEQDAELNVAASGAMPAEDGDKPATENPELSFKASTDAVDSSTADQPTGEEQSGDAALPVTDTESLISEDISTSQKTDKASEGKAPQQLQTDAPKQDVTEKAPSLGDETAKDATAQTTTPETTGAAAGNSAADSDSTPRDRRDRRSRSNDSEGRSSNVPSLETAKDRIVEASASAAPSATPQTTTAPTETGLAPATDQALAAAVPTPAASTLPQAAAVTAAAVSQTASAAATSASARGESSTSSSPVVGGVSGTSADASETINLKSTPASRQAEVADRARLVHRIAKAFQKMGVDGGQVRLRMHPDDLGSVQLDMQVSGRKVSAKVIAESDEAVQLLQASLPELRQKLESQGLVVERLDVERRAEEETGGWRGQNQSQNQAGYGDQSSRQDDLWGRQAAASANANRLNSRESSQKAVFASSVVTSSRATLPGDRALDLKA